MRRGTSVTRGSKAAVPKSTVPKLPAIDIQGRAMRRSLRVHAPPSASAAMPVPPSKPPVLDAVELETGEMTEELPQPVPPEVKRHMQGKDLPAPRKLCKKGLAG